MEGLHRLPGGLAVRAVDPSPALSRVIARELGPADVAAGSPRATVTVCGVGRGEQSPVCEETSGDPGDGRIVGRAGDTLVVVNRSGWYSIDKAAAMIVVDCRSREWAFAREVLRPVVQRSGLGNGVAVAHASAVDVGNGGVLIGGWSESGKTEIALAMAERGSGFLGDKWTILFPPDRAGGGTSEIAPYPMPVGIRDWVLPWLPRLTEALGRRRRGRLFAGSGAASLARTMAGIGSIHPVADVLLAPLAELGSVGGTARIDASVVRRAYGQAVAVTDRPLHAAVILTTVPDGAQPSVAPIPTEVASLRLAQSAAYERRSFHLIGERARFHFAAQPPIPAFDAIADEATVLAERLAGVPTFELRTPFPGNPAVAAELILSVV